MSVDSTSPGGLEDPFLDWALDQIVLRLLSEVSQRLTSQERRLIVLRHCIIVTRSEGYHIGWDEDGRLHCCRFVAPPPSVARFLYDWHPVKEGRPVIFDLRCFPDVDSITVPLRCEYHFGNGPMCGRGGMISLNSQGKCTEAARWLS